jgi:plastocyanin
MSELRIFALAGALALGLAALSGAAAALAPAAIAVAAPAGPKVNIDNFTFAPVTLTVGVGTTVTWTNRDDIPHTVTATDRSFKSKVMDTEGVFAFTFTKPGTYGYFCSIHPHMVGTVVVKGA